MRATRPRIFSRFRQPRPCVDRIIGRPWARILDKNVSFCYEFVNQEDQEKSLSFLLKFPPRRFAHRAVDDSSEVLQQETIRLGLANWKSWTWQRPKHSFIQGNSNPERFRQRNPNFFIRSVSRLDMVNLYRWFSADVYFVGVGFSEFSIKTKCVACDITKCVILIRFSQNISPQHSRRFTQKSFGKFIMSCHDFIRAVIFLFLPAQFKFYLPLLNS